jgi:hypothetical protein
LAGALRQPFSRDGVFADMLTLQAAVGASMFERMKATPTYARAAKIAPHPKEFPALPDGKTCAPKQAGCQGRI